MTSLFLHSIKRHMYFSTTQLKYLSTVLFYQITVLHLFINFNVMFYQIPVSFILMQCLTKYLFYLFILVQYSFKILFYLFILVQYSIKSVLFIYFSAKCFQ